MTDNETRDSWERFLNPEMLRKNLTVASVYLAGFEILKQSIVGHLKSFYTNGFDENGPSVSPQYDQEVLSKNRSPIYASLLWLKEHEALTDDDLSTYEVIKGFRNIVAHEISTIMYKGMNIESVDRFHDMVTLLKKIETWWIVEVELPTNPDTVGKEYDAEGIVPGSVITLRLLADVGLGDDDEAWFYYKEFVKSMNADKDA